MKTLNFDNYKQVFGYKSFRYFWTGFTFSVLGDTMTRVALTWLVWELTGSAWALGWLTFTYTAPVLIGGLVAGWLLDRFGQQKVMMLDSILRGAVVLLIPLLNAGNWLELWHIYAVAAVYGFLFMIPLAGSPALMPRLVDRRHLATANALETLTYTVSNVVGAPLAGFLIAAITSPYVLIIDSVSYFLFALFLIKVKTLAAESIPDERIQQSYHLGDAVRLLRGNKILLSTTVMFMAANLGMGAMFVWLPIFADRILGGGPELYGTLLGFMALGEVFSAILAGSLALPFTLGTLICAAQFLAGTSLAVLLLGKHESAAIVGLTLFGLFVAPLTIWAQTLRMQIIPEGLRGRTFALLRTLMQSANPLGGLAGGVLVPILGIPVMITFSALIIGIPGLAGYRVEALRHDGVPTYTGPDPI